jgi:hypothetical protein
MNAKNVDDMENTKLAIPQKCGGPVHFSDRSRDMVSELPSIQFCPGGEYPVGDFLPNKFESRGLEERPYRRRGLDILC